MARKFLSSISNYIIGENRNKCHRFIFRENLIIRRKNFVPTFSCLLVTLSWNFRWICVTQFYKDAFCHTEFEFHLFFHDVIVIYLFIWYEPKLKMKVWRVWGREGANKGKTTLIHLKRHIDLCLLYIIWRKKWSIPVTGGVNTVSRTNTQRIRLTRNMLFHCPKWEMMINM